MADHSQHDRMTRRDFIGVLATSAAMASLPGLINHCNQSGKRPNIIVVFDDQARVQEMGCYGGKNVTTPNLDRMALEGVRLTHATSTCPLCTPYRGMMQTGRYPTHSGIVLNWVNVNPNQRSIAHVFKDAGYNIAFFGKWHLASGARTMNGLRNTTLGDKRRIWENSRIYAKMNPETEFVPPGPQRLGYEHWEAFNFHVDFNNYWYYHDRPEKIYSGKYETDTQVGQAIAYMEEHLGLDNPFFMMILPHPPHPPFHSDYCPTGYLEKIKPVDQLYWRSNVPDGFPDTLDTTRWKQDIVSNEARFYYAMLKNMDDNMGHLLRFLDESGFSQHTILIFTSDHGEMLGSHGLMNKMVPYAESVDIPFIARWPGNIPAGMVIDALHEPIDHLPTLCGLAGIQCPNTGDGIDLSDVILGKETDSRDALLMANYVSDWDYCDSGTTWPEWRGLRTKLNTYVNWLDGREELYHDKDDPYQQRNLAKGQQDLPTLHRMRARLKDLLSDAHDSFLPGTAYAEWYDEKRNLVKTGLGNI